MKVLLVDDEKKFAIMLAKRLALRGIETDYVHSAQEAVEMVQKKTYDVAVLDVKMPGVGGIELRRKLKKMAPDLKVIFLTGHGSKNDFEVGSTEAELYLSKPLEIETLVEALQSITH